MYIRRIVLKNIKCFNKFDYSFDNQEGEGIESIVIAGDNGDGKSTILRSIAISLCDQWTAAGLLRELSGEFTRSGEDSGIIVLELQSNKTIYRVKTEIKWNDNETYEYPKRNIRILSEAGKSNKIKDSHFNWKDVFATGYGAGLRTLGTQDFQHYFTGDSIYSLFKDDVSLQNPELAILRLSANTQLFIEGNEITEIDKIQKELLDWLAKILLMKNRKIILRPNGLHIVDDGDLETPLSASGDGYKALTSLILDLLSWWFLYQFYDSNPKSKRKKLSFDDLKEIEGIVIIDELEQHLHPKWQREILGSLQSNFPKVQFVVTTHSPLVASTSNNQTLILENGQVRKEKLYGWLAEDVYKQMGLSQRRTPDVEGLIMEFNELYVKRLNGRLTSSEKQLFEDLNKTLCKLLPEHDPVLETIRLSALAQAMEQ